MQVEFTDLRSTVQIIFKDEDKGFCFFSPVTETKYCIDRRTLTKSPYLPNQSIGSHHWLPDRLVTLVQFGWTTPGRAQALKNHRIGIVKRAPATLLARLGRKDFKHLECFGMFWNFPSMYFPVFQYLHLVFPVLHRLRVA